MKYILIAATALFAFSSANAQMDKINSAKEKSKTEISKGEEKIQDQKENIKSDVIKVENTTEIELKTLVNMSKEDITKKMATMSKEEKRAFKAEVSEARATLNTTISKLKEAKKDLSNKGSNLSTKGKEKQEKSITNGRSELMKKQEISKKELHKMESMSADEVNKLEKIEKAKVKEVQANVSLSASEGKVISALTKIQAAQAKLDAAKMKGSKSAEEIAAFQAKIDSAKEKMYGLKTAVIKGRSIMKE